MPARHAQREHFSDRSLCRLACAIVHQLGDETCADIADMVGTITHDSQHRLEPIIGGPVTADPNTHLRALRAERAAADRSIEYMGPLEQEGVT